MNVKIDRSEHMRRPVKTRGSNTEHHLAIRRVEFDWSNSPLEWIPKQRYASFFINVIHLLLPLGEYWFCKIYKQALPYITDEKLREDVKGFIQQEAMHARAHDSAIDDYLAKNDINPRGYRKLMLWLFDVVLADKILGLIPTGRILYKPWLSFRLGVVAAIEHFTCVLGMYAIDNKLWDEAGADPVVLDILRWHGAEEVEHRCVAYDVHQDMGGWYVTRFPIMLISIVAVLGLWAYGASYLMRQDDVLKKHKPSVLRPWLWREWSRVAKTGHLPSLSYLLREATTYFRRSYHPIEEADTQVALDYLASSPAAARAGSKYATNVH